MNQVAQELGNTPAVTRRSYVDPRVVQLFHDGITADVTERHTVQAPDESDERAVLELLG